MPDDDPFADEGPFGSPLPPEDRLWRHPSELAWTPLEEPRMPTAPAVAPVGSTGTGRGRLWGVALTSGLTGAVLAIGVVTLVGGLGQRVTERIVERVPITGDALGSTKGVAGVPDVVDDVAPSVVRIDVAGPDGMVTGSGVVLRDDGTILTNAHLVEGATSVGVVLADGVALRGRVVGTDRLTDVGVVVVDDAEGVTWTPAVLGSGDELEVGQPAIAVGSPLGRAIGPSVTAGVVSGLGRRVTTGDDVVLHGLIQTDAEVADESTGGALCDGGGVVVGLMTALPTDGRGYAIPADVARAVADDLLSGDGIRRAWLGIRGTDVLATGSTVSTAPGVTGAAGGVKIVAVDEASPALAAGVLPGDVLVTLDGVPIATMSQLVLVLRDRAPGDTVAVDLVRGSEALRVEVVLGERP